MDIKSSHTFIHAGLMDFFGLFFVHLIGGGNHTTVCNPYYRLIYVFYIFDLPTNVPANLSRLRPLEA